MIGYINLNFPKSYDFKTQFKRKNVSVSIITYKNDEKWIDKSIYESEQFMFTSITHEHGLSINGSLRDFYNDINGLVNYNDLTHSELCEAIYKLSNELYDSEISKLTKLEFGLNIIPDSLVESIIRKNLLWHKRNGYSHNKKDNIKGVLKYFEYTNYHIVAYNKALQLDSCDNVFRLELRLIKPIELKELGIVHLSDLKNKMILQKLFDLFLKRFDELTIIDSFDPFSLSTKDQAKMYLYMKEGYWSDIPTTINGRKKKSRDKKNFERIMEEYKLNSLKLFLRNSFVEKFNTLLEK